MATRRSLRLTALTAVLLLPGCAPPRYVTAPEPVTIGSPAQATTVYAVGAAAVTPPSASYTVSAPPPPPKRGGTGRKAIPTGAPGQAPDHGSGNRGPAEADDSLSDVDEALDHLAQGKFKFDAPDKMNLYETVTVRAQVQGSAVQAEHAPAQPGQQVYTAVIPLSKHMSAELTGDDFTITPQFSDPVQLVTSGVTEWRWDIKPKSAGKHHLHVIITTIVEAGAESGKRNKVLDADITIEVTLMQEIRDAFEQHGEWFWASIVVPLGGIIWKYRKKLAKALTGFKSRLGK